RYLHPLPTPSFVRGARPRAPCTLIFGPRGTRPLERPLERPQPRRREAERAEEAADLLHVAVDQGADVPRAQLPEVLEHRLRHAPADRLAAMGGIDPQHLDPAGGLVEAELARAHLAEHEPDDL